MPPGRARAASGPHPSPHTSDPGSVPTRRGRKPGRRGGWGQRACPGPSTRRPAGRQLPGWALGGPRGPGKRAHSHEETALGPRGLPHLLPAVPQCGDAGAGGRAGQGGTRGPGRRLAQHAVAAGLPQSQAPRGRRLLCRLRRLVPKAGGLGEREHVGGERRGPAAPPTRLLRPAVREPPGARGPVSAPLVPEPGRATAGRQGCDGRDSKGQARSAVRVR